MSRVIFINRYFHPDHSATSQILSDLAFTLAREGRDVHVLTSRQIYDQPDARLKPREEVGGVTVHRVATTRYGRSGLAGRTIDYLSFYLSISRMVAALVRRGDIVIAKTDPPLVSLPAAAIVRLRRAHLVNWLQDVYPEIAIELGVPLLSGPAGGLLKVLRNWSLRAARCNVVLGDGMAQRLRGFGVDRGRIRVIPNWADDRALQPVPVERNPLRAAWKLDGLFVVGYSGNLGRAHEFETVLAAAAELRDEPRIVFVCIGGGGQFEALERRVRQEGLDGAFRFFPYQSLEALQHSLAVADVHWISMRPPLEGLIFPSKFYGIAAAGRPMIAVTGSRGEIADLVRSHAIGAVVEPGDGAGLARTIRAFAVNPSECAEMGRRARAMLEARFAREHALGRWRGLLDETAAAAC